MKQADLKALIRECLQEVLAEGDRVCMDCDTKLGSDPRINGVSHGICPACLEKRKIELRGMKAGMQHAPGTGAAGLPSKTAAQIR
jgi:hypothetical protein